jgi:hypothetical protein
MARLSALTASALPVGRAIHCPDYPVFGLPPVLRCGPMTDNIGMSTATIPASRARISDKPDRSFRTVMAGTAAGLMVSFLIGRSKLFTPGDNIGYYVGLVGGVMMLLLLLYPLRKYVAAFRNLGAVRHWFAVHMVFGIVGPILVLAHSTYHMRSTNAAVALICMLVVAGSGIVGRFFYTKVHRGLYGEKSNLKELQADAGLESEEVHSRLHFAPGVEKQLQDFQTYALSARKNLLDSSVRFLSLGYRRFLVQRRCQKQLLETMKNLADAREWDPEKLKRRHEAAMDLVAAYLNSVQRVAEFDTYDRLLQLWHVAHVPLVYLLVISAIAHVVAVHMY